MTAHADTPELRIELGQPIPVINPIARLEITGDETVAINEHKIQLNQGQIAVFNALANNRQTPIPAKEFEKYGLEGDGTDKEWAAFRSFALKSLTKLLTDSSKKEIVLKHGRTKGTKYQFNPRLDITDMREDHSDSATKPNLKGWDTISDPAQLGLSNKDLVKPDSLNQKSDPAPKRQKVEINRTTVPLGPPKSVTPKISKAEILERINRELGIVKDSYSKQFIDKPNTPRGRDQLRFNLASALAKMLETQQYAQYRPIGSNQSIFPAIFTFFPGIPSEAFKEAFDELRSIGVVNAHGFVDGSEQITNFEITPYGKGYIEATADAITTKEAHFDEDEIDIVAEQLEITIDSAIQLDREDLISDLKSRYKRTKLCEMSLDEFVETSKTIDAVAERLRQDILKRALKRRPKQRVFR